MNPGPTDKTIATTLFVSHIPNGCSGSGVDGRTQSRLDDAKRLRSAVRVSIRRIDSRKTIGFRVENRTGDRHTTGLRVSFPEHAAYEVRQNGTAVPLVQTGNWDYPWRAELSMTGAGAAIELVRVAR